MNTEPLSGRESHENHPGGTRGAETTPAGRTGGISGLPEASEADANPAPLTDDRLAAIEARVNAALRCPNAEANGRLDGQHTLTGSFTHIRCELCNYTRPRGERVEESAALLAEVKRLRALESAALHARSALAALCYDLEDPGSNALGALYLLQQATLYADSPKDDTSDALLQHACKVLHGIADMADPEPPEVSFFGPTFGPQVADWLRMLADRKAVTA